MILNRPPSSALGTVRSSKESNKALLAEVQKLKSVNEILVGRVEAKEKRIKVMEEQVWQFFYFFSK